MTEDTMAIEFKGRHDHISARMKDHATKKLARLQRYNTRIDRIEVVADHAHENPEVELITHMKRGKPLVAKEQADTFANAIDLLVEKMEKQLKRQKEKRTAHKTAPAKARGRSKGSGEPASEETYEEVVRRSLRG